jgi:hypothetical protein
MPQLKLLVRKAVRRYWPVGRLEDTAVSQQSNRPAVTVLVTAVMMHAASHPGTSEPRCHNLTVMLCLHHR